MVNNITANEHTRNPLFLSLLLEELVQFGRFSTLPGKVQDFGLVPVFSWQKIRSSLVNCNLNLLSRPHNHLFPGRRADCLSEHCRPS